MRSRTTMRTYGGTVMLSLALALSVMTMEGAHAESETDTVSVVADLRRHLQQLPVQDFVVDSRLSEFVTQNDAVFPVVQYPTTVPKPIFSSGRDSTCCEDTFKRLADDPIAIDSVKAAILPYPIDIAFPWFPRGLVFNNITGVWSPWQTVCVNVSQGPIDVLYLADTTGSMGSFIAAIKAAAASMHSTLVANLTNLKVGISAYKDTGDVYVYKNFQSIATLTPAAFSAGIAGSWSASGGGDWPEAQLFALREAANQAATGWRNASTKVIIWFGDAPGHDPSHAGVTLAAAQAALLAKGIKVMALDCSQLNSPNPTPQATTLATATGGFYGPVSASTIAGSMVTNLVSNIAIPIKAIVTCPTNTPIIIEINPPTTIATPLKPGCFSIRVKACNASDCAKAGRYICSVQFIDTSNLNVLSTYPIIINTAPGSDTAPPVLSPFLPPIAYRLECPNYVKCPTLTATDNCDGTWPVTPTITVRSTICNSTTTCSWVTKDAAGNVASTSQVATIVDTTPPALSPACARNPLCITPTAGVATTCLDILSTIIKRCFYDICDRAPPVKWEVKCVNCSAINATNGLSIPATLVKPSISCGVSSSDKLCFNWIQPVRPSCCTLLVKVWDKCGNSKEYPVKVCSWVSGTTATSRPPYNCITDVGIPIDAIDATGISTIRTAG